MTTPEDLLADMVLPNPGSPTAAFDTGTVTSLVDASHIKVDLGDRKVTVYVPQNLAGRAAVDSSVRVSRQQNTHVLDSVLSGTVGLTASEIVSGTFALARIPTHTHDAADITSGLLSASRLPTATTSVQGAMPAADKTKLDNATTPATASRLVIRDALGRAQFTDPSTAQDAATKNYVDAADATKLNTVRPFGHMGKTGGFQALDGPGIATVWMDAAQILRGGMTFNNANDGLVIPTTGWYRIHIKAFFTGAACVVNQSGIIVNGVTSNGAMQGANGQQNKADGNDIYYFTSAMYFFTSGAIVSLYQDSGVSVSCWGTNGYDGSWLELEYFSS